MFIDFHTHTTGSDGSLTPNELINQASKEGIEIISITDHDTVEGVHELLSSKSVFDPPGEKQVFDCLFLPGLEISAEFPGTLHILGYGINPNNLNLIAVLEALQSVRLRRNEMMIEMMNNRGFAISIDELYEISGGDLIGRPHFAQLLMKKGYVSTTQEAFDKYLARGAEFYLDKKRLSPRESIELILQAGGLPVMAHPYQTKRSGEELEKLVRDLKSYGLLGIEVFYSRHSDAMINEYMGFAKRLGLFATAGSDFHGATKPDISLGMRVPFSYIHDFMNRIFERLLSIPKMCNIEEVV